MRLVISVDPDRATVVEREKIDRTLPENLIRNVPVPTLCVANLCEGHERSLRSPPLNTTPVRTRASGGSRHVRPDRSDREHVARRTERQICRAVTLASWRAI